MTTRIPLDGTWHCKPYVGEEWRFRRPFAEDSNDVHGWIPAVVPGSVVADLVRAGEVADPLVDRRTRDAEWVATRSWAYRRQVDLPPTLDGCRVVLHLEGVDHAADVFVNGTHVGACEQTFVPADFDVTAAVRPGGNLVTVLLAPAPDGEPQVGRTERVRTAKSRMTYGWDFCPRLVHVGIWDRCWLDVVGDVQITGLVVRPRVDLGAGRARVDWEATVDAVAPVTADVVVRRGARTVAARGATAEGPPADPSGGGGLAGSIDIDDPELWWPVGHGGQPLYTLAVAVTADDAGGPGAPPAGASGDHRGDVREVRFGLRRIALADNEVAPAGARPYTLVVNDRRVYIHGWNWVPMDIHHGPEDPDRLAHLVGLARAVGVNLLRVWGGGLIEKETFYDACDRAGILVWQEFPLSSSGISSVPSEDPAYVARLRRTAEAAVRRRHHHPSLALWCGGNELDGADGRPLDGSQPAITALADVVAHLDPDRPFLPTSPTGPVANCTLEAVESDPDGQHDVHGPWEHQGIEGQRTLYDRATSLLHSEFGVEGMTNLATLEAFVSPEHRRPADRSNPVWVHRGDWWINTPFVRDCFPGAVDDLPALARASQFLQAEGLRYAVEANRRRQWRNSGSLPWQFNESFPNGFCTSAVDHRGRPKAVYYDVARAYRPLHPSAAFPTIAWRGRAVFTATIWVSTGRDVLRGQVDARLVGVDGSAVCGERWDVSVPADSSQAVAEVTWPLEALDGEVFWLDLGVRGEDERVGSRYAFSRTHDLAPLLRLPATTLTVHGDATGVRDTAGVTVRNAGDVVAAFVTATDARPADAPGYVRFDAGHETLLPGEARHIGVRWTGVAPGQRRIAVAGWNTGVTTRA